MSGPADRLEAMMCGAPSVGAMADREHPMSDHDPAAQQQPYPYPPPPTWGPMAPKRPNRNRDTFLGLALAGGLIVLMAIIGGLVASGGDEDTTTEATATDAAATDPQPETDSGNETNPPPADLNDDVSCTSERFTGPAAAGTVTNHSSELSAYTISVAFLDAAGVQVAEADAYLSAVPAGATARWEATSYDEAAYETCEVVEVERRAS